jgi:hypothetical protein
MKSGMTRRGAVLGVALSATWTSAGVAQPAFVLTVARKFSSDSCTSGYLAVNGKIIAYTLELPWQGNAPMISSIPEGRYGATLRYDHSDRWRLELTGVPGRSNVQIHIGNTTADVRGCILVGTGVGEDLCSVTGSRAAYADLKEAFYGSPDPVMTPNKDITVVVES